MDALALLLFVEVSIFETLAIATTRTTNKTPRPGWGAEERGEGGVFRVIRSVYPLITFLGSSTVHVLLPLIMVIGVMMEMI